MDDKKRSSALDDLVRAEVADGLYDRVPKDWPKPDKRRPLAGDTCYHFKVKYPSREAAEARILELPNAPKLYTYACAICGCWHLTKHLKKVEPLPHAD